MNEYTGKKKYGYRLLLVLKISALFYRDEKEKKVLCAVWASSGICNDPFVSCHLFLPSAKYTLYLR